MPTNIIRLSAERHHQVKALADRRKQTIAECVGDLISAELDRLEITNEIGFSTFDCCKLENGNVWFSAAEIGNREWTPEVAESLAASIEAVAAPKGARKRVLDMDAGLLVSRNGNSVKIENVETEGGRSVAVSVAHDLARLIKSAAHEAIAA